MEIEDTRIKRRDFSESYLSPYQDALARLGAGTQLIRGLLPRAAMPPQS